MITTQCTTIDNLIKNTFKESFDFLGNQVNDKTIQLINESIFKDFFIQYLYQNKTVDINFEDECNRINLLLHNDSTQWSIEFKFYDIRPSYCIDGKPNADKKNFNELLHSAEKSLDIEKNLKGMNFNIADRYYILLASEHQDIENKYSILYNNDYYHINELNKKGIRAKEIIRKNRIIGNMTLFGWVFKIMPADENDRQNGLRLKKRIDNERKKI
jgi:hypothetical protein